MDRCIKLHGCPVPVALVRATYHGTQETLPIVGNYPAYCKAGPLDGCQLFEERRWLIRNLSPLVADGNPVLGKDERPTFPSRPVLVFARCGFACGCFRLTATSI